MEIAIIILVIIFSFILIKWCVKLRRFIKLMKKFPNPPTVPIFGNALSFKSLKDVIPKFGEFTEKYGNKVALYIGPFPNTLLITDTKFAAHVLLSNKVLRKGKEYEFFTRWLGKNLLTSYGDDVWKKHRTVINPSFHIQILKGFIEIFQSNANILASKLEREIGKSSFDIHPYVAMCSLDNISETAMGTSINAQNNNNHSNYIESVKLMCNLVVSRGLNPIYRTELFYKFSNLYRQEKRAVKILHEYTENVIKQKKKLHHQTQLKLSDSKKKQKMILLDSLMQLNETSNIFTDVQIRNEVNTFMFAGHDTVSSALNFAIFALANNPTIQDKVVEELDIIFGDDKTKSLTLNDIQSMRYLEAVIKEVMRMYSPVTFVTRSVDKEFEYDGYTVPEECNLIIYIYGIHHDPKLFPEPDIFNPQRFLSEDMEEKGNFDYIPFSFGPRNCIGQKFAMIELKTVLAVLLQNYEFSPSNPSHTLELSAEGILVSKNGVLVSLNRRKC